MKTTTKMPIKSLENISRINMMKQRLALTLFSRISLVVLITQVLGCVSVNIGPEKPKRAEKVKFYPPNGSFVGFKNDYVDAAWKNEKSGSSISFFSDCSTGNETGLESLKSKPLEGIEELKIKKDQSLTFNGRKAYRTTYTGSVDGIESQFDILVFKKNNCSYILNFVSLPQHFSNDVQAFEKFLKSFEAP